MSRDGQSGKPNEFVFGTFSLKIKEYNFLNLIQPRRRTRQFLNLKLIWRNYLNTFKVILCKHSRYSGMPKKEPFTDGKQNPGCFFHFFGEAGEK